MIKPGSTVTDLRGRYLGIILRHSDIYPDQFYIRYWDIHFNMYLHYLRREDLVQEVNDPRLLSWFNNYDYATRLDIRQNCIELALETKDKAWFEWLVKMVP